MIFFQNDLHHMVAYAQELARCMPARGKILDLGCGDNTALAQFRNFHREVWGTDFQKHPNLVHPSWFRLIDQAGKLPFPDNSFDLVNTLWVLEHVRCPGTFFSEIRRILKPGGIFLAHTISGLHYVTWIRRLFSLLPHWVSQQVVQRLYGRPCHDTFPTHYRLNTKSTLRDWGTKTNLNLVQLQHYADSGYFAFCKPLQVLAQATDWLLEKVKPGCGRIYLTATLQKQTGRTNKIEKIGQIEATGELPPPGHGIPEAILTTQRCPC